MRRGKFFCFSSQRQKNWRLNWCPADLYWRADSTEQWSHNWTWLFYWTDPVACIVKHTGIKAEHVLFQRKKTDYIWSQEGVGGGGGLSPSPPPPPPPSINQLSSFLSTFKRVRIDILLTQLFITCSTTRFVYRTSAEGNNNAYANPPVSAFPKVEIEPGKVHGFLSK